MVKLSGYIPGFLKTKWGIGTLIVVVLLGGWYWYAHSGKTSYQFISVTRGAITQTVSVTGNTTPVSSVSLGFGNSGTVSRIFAKVGDRVSEGALLAALNTSDLSAQLQQAEANVDTQKARLASLTVGAQPEDIAATQAAYDKSAQDLANLYAGISDTASDAYAKANDAVRTQLSAFFSNAESSQPHLSFSTASSQAAADAQGGRVAAGTALNIWQSSLASISPASLPASIDAAIQTDLSYLATVRTFLGSVTDAANGANGLDATTLATYKAAAAAAVTELNTAIRNLNTASQTISSQKLLVAQAAAQLALKKAGATKEDLAAQAAQVSQAEAQAASIRARLQNSQIVAPQSGIVTQFDAKVGQLATANVPLVSIISDGTFEIHADVPEIDIGSISVGDEVSMTLDAFPGETFTGKVFYIDPAETMNQGVVYYQVKASFDKPDKRLKSGLTANLEIRTEQKDGVLILPQYAIIQNDEGAFVKVLKGGTATDTPVTLGIQDTHSNVEIISGVTEGEQVVNIGLKQ